eukprot:CAMPEP_0185547360 /NCGR_PEP_ID=MMETSP1381-20130426/6070_1 /TAXON_ID=298111 /ORGANISM="Pavlova sp., Strain CCMP459" /LENGTH=183 /DNA_ID=CAMNT_0028159901 /DNA_START=6 /DNA_END=557 /DNA_ORIENTATION=-
MSLRIFKPLGCEFDVASDGKEAVRMALERPGGYTLILMDNQMPNMTGTEATRELRAAGYIWPIIGMTGDPHGSEDRNLFEDSGVDECVDKSTEGVTRVQGRLHELLADVEDWHSPGHQASSGGISAPARQSLSTGNDSHGMSTVMNSIAFPAAAWNTGRRFTTFGRLHSGDLELFTSCSSSNA